MFDLSALFVFSAEPLEIVFRGTAAYWFLFVLFRFVLKRDAGSIAIADILLLVLIADASQNAMAASFDSLADGGLLVATIAGWSYLLDWASFRWPAMRRVFEPTALTLVRDGRINRANLRREMVTVEELMAAARQHGVESLDRVKLARLESDGRISIIQQPNT